MWHFAVWAPIAKSVAVRIGNRDHALNSHDDGWWRGDVAEASAGTDYSFVLNDGSPLPDPRSASQPFGVHGPSRTVDHSAFEWRNRDWHPVPLASAIVYELHVGTFTPTGSFDSTIERLAYLKALGITHVELMPVNEFSGEWGWGYDGVDLYAPHHAYGGPEGLKRLVNACHVAGLAVILDVVYNHLGPTGNYLSQFGPYFTERHKTPWGPAVNLDGPGSLEARRFFCDNALMWLRDYHFDGLRLDAVHTLIDNSKQHFLAQLAAEVKGLHEDKFLIAESDLNDPILLRNPPEGYGIDAQWSDDFHHSIHSLLTGETSTYYQDFGGLAPLAKALKDSFVYDGVFSEHRKRPHGAPARDLPQYKFLGYSQTHDQVGNRARGERLSHLISLGRVKIAAALVLLSPFVPMLFQGEEFAASSPFQFFTQHEEEELARAVSEGRKREYGTDAWDMNAVPDPQDPATFKRSKLNWTELDREPHREVLEWYRALIKLRSSSTDLAAGQTIRTEVEHGHDWIHIVRGSTHILCNLASMIVRFPIAIGAEILIASDDYARVNEGLVTLAADAVVVLHLVSERGR